MKKYYPNQLSYGANNTVVALSDTEVAKIFTNDTRSDIGSEAEKMKFANTINDLVVKFLRLDFNEAEQWDILVMERIYPIDFRSYEVEKRELWLEVFEDELKQLHRAGFVHRDLSRPSNISGDKFDNILLTPTGLRLIDVGISALKSQVGELLFTKFIQVEMQQLESFKQYFLSR
jgi:serine/threonine protein kinase